MRGGIEVDFEPGVLAGGGLGERFVGYRGLRQRVTEPFPGVVVALPVASPEPSIGEVLGARNRFLVIGGAVLGVAVVAAGVAVLWDSGSEGDTPPAEPGTPGTATAAGAVTSVTATASVAVEPGPASADLRAARTLQREGRYDEARDAFEALAAKSKDPTEKAEALLGAGTSAFEVNDSEAGFRAFRGAVEAAPAQSSASLRAYYLLTKELNDIGEFEEAAAAYKAAGNPSSGSPITPYLKFEGGRARWAHGGQAIWAALLSEPTASAALKTAIRRESVSMWRQRGDTAQLTAALEQLIADTGEAAARFERAELAETAGDTETYAEQLRAIVAEEPGSRFAGLALERLDAASLGVDPGLAGLSYYRRGQHAQAKAVLVPAVEAGGAPADVAFRGYYLGASYEDSGDGANAIWYYDIAGASGANSPFVHRAKYWAARTAEWSSTPANASARYVDLATNGPAGEFTQEAAFRAGFLLYEAGDS